MTPMGTRHLIAVQIDGKYPVAQYGQWDGYPDGQGLKVLAFLRDEMREDTFQRKVRALRVIDDAWKLAQFPGATSLKDVSGEPVAHYLRKYTQLSRDASSTVLAMIQSGDEGMPIETEITFAGESLMCEWAYVIDFDNRTFEVFRGFNKEPLDPTERFASQPTSDYIPSDGVPYKQVKHVYSWSLDTLPTAEEFMATLTPADEADEAA
jgi:hypothetical protein